MFLRLNMASSGFALRLRNLLISQTASGTPEQVEQENMEDLSVEVCGKNGAYYKVKTTISIHNSGNA